MRTNPKTAAAVGLVATLCVGCGGGSSRSDAARTALMDAAARTNEARSARVAVTLKVGGDDARTMTAEGETDIASHRSRMVLLPGRAINGVGPREIAMITNETAVYLMLPAGPVPLPKPWVRFNGRPVDEFVPLDLTAILAMASGSNPNWALEALNSAPRDVKAAGTQTVRGRATTRYRATVDVAGEATRAEFWIDGEGLARRITLMPHPDSGGVTTSSEITYELFEFGAPVDVTPPPASQVSSVSDYVRSTGRGG